jgi:hypothetical protein
MEARLSPPLRRSRRSSIPIAVQKLLGGLLRILALQLLKDHTVLDLESVTSGHVYKWSRVWVNVLQREPNAEKIIDRKSMKERRVAVNWLLRPVFK